MKLFKIPRLSLLASIPLLALLLLTGCGQILKPNLPIAVVYRLSLVGKGYVAVFHNTSNKYLTIIVEFEDVTLGDKKTETIDLPPFGEKEIGWKEGWKFASGDTIIIRHADYKIGEYKIP
jgi:hypothetical protein